MDTDGIPLPWSLKGHKLSRSWSGRQSSSNARGECECGWRFAGWTNTMSSVVMAHRSHMRRERLAACRDTQQLIPATPRQAAAMMFECD